MTLIRTKIPPRRYITRAQAMMAEKRFCLESYLYDPSVLSSSSATGETGSLGGIVALEMLNVVAMVIGIHGGR
ncbi:hypothetical protein HPB47_001821 [Ixodes persulcatus]|uniref:Uncharacterized protein n=1 Tax=Ixodes persulcatus TaxID=34615 RepID=A0AC60PP79_IXOPE|nr:hypothetical protein HPB47_001821 [Ixodes persulcatus]